jgi:hypothetical protein
MINGRSRLQGSDVKIACIQSKIETISNDILINEEDIATLSNNLAINYANLSNLIVDNRSEIKSLSNAYYPFKTSTNSKITTPQEFNMVFYGDLRNLDNKIDVVEGNASQNSSNITSLSNLVSETYIR